MWLKMAGSGLILVLLTACQVKPEQAEERVLGTAEVRAVFSGKTVEAYNLLTGTTSFTYYAENGQLLQERYWETRSGHWEVNKQGEICLQLEDKPAKCRAILLRNGRYYKQRPDGQGGQESIIRYRQFIPGNVLSGN